MFKKARGRIDVSYMVFSEKPSLDEEQTVYTFLLVGEGARGRQPAVKEACRQG